MRIKIKIKIKIRILKIPSRRKLKYIEWLEEKMDDDDLILDEPDIWDNIVQEHSEIIHKYINYYNYKDVKL